MTAAEFWKEWSWNDTGGAIKEFDRPVTQRIMTLLQRFAEAYLAHRQAEPKPSCPKCGETDLRFTGDRSRVYCWPSGKRMDDGMPTHMHSVATVADFAQFFGPAEQWIPCSERLPDNEVVLFYTNEGMIESGYHRAEGYWECERTGTHDDPIRFIFTYYDKDEHVTHWQPLPAPPKQKG